MVPPLLPVKPLGPLNLCEEAAAILEIRSAEVLADPDSSAIDRAKAATIWPQFAAKIRAGLVEFRQREALIVQA